MKENVFGENLYNLRKLHKLSQVQLGTLCNYSNTVIANWEKGDSLPDINVAKSLAEIFGVNLDFMLSTHKNIDYLLLPRKQFVKYLNILIVSISLISLIILEYFNFTYSGKNNYFLIPILSSISFIFLLIVDIIFHKKINFEKLSHALLLSIFSIFILFVLVKENLFTAPALTKQTIIALSIITIVFILEELAFSIIIKLYRNGYKYLLEKESKW